MLTCVRLKQIGKKNMEDIISAIQKIGDLSESQGGVFSLSDIKNIFGVISKDR